MASQALLLLSWGLAAGERTLGLLAPLAVGGVVLRHWRAARRWAWTTLAVLMALAWLLADLPTGLCTALPWLLGASLGLTAWSPRRSA